VYTSPATAWLSWHPRRFEWTGPLLRKTKSSLCAWAITFQSCYTCFECARGEENSPFGTTHTRSGPTQPHIQWVQGLLIGSTMARTWSKQNTLCTVEVKEWNHTATTMIRIGPNLPFNNFTQEPLLRKGFHSLGISKILLIFSPRATKHTTPVMFTLIMSDYFKLWNIHFVSWNSCCLLCLKIKHFLQNFVPKMRSTYKLH
jgi:hypothetical protein